MAGSVYHGLLIVSMVILFHAAYSAAEWRSHARKSEQIQIDSIPLDITIETVAALLMAMAAVLKIGGETKFPHTSCIDNFFYCNPFNIPACKN
jgi:hypothetical protein